MIRQIEKASGRSPAFLLLASLLGAAALGAGCYSAPEGAAPNGEKLGAPAGSPASASAAAVGLPCAVSELLVARCQRCHGPTSKTMPLVTYEDLVAPAKSDPTRKVAELCVERMRHPTDPMPPSGDRVADATIATFEAWVKKGAPAEACGAAPAGVSAPGASSTAPEPSGATPPPGSGSPATACGTLDNAKWQAIYTSYFGPNTPGHCADSGCHASSNGGLSFGSNATASSMLATFISRGLISTTNPTASRMVGSNSPIVWFNPSGPMPEDNRTANPQAAADIKAWLADFASCDAGAPTGPTPGPGSPTTAGCAAGQVAITLTVTSPDDGEYVDSRPAGLSVYAGETQTACFAAGSSVELRSSGPTSWTGIGCGSERCTITAAALTITADIED